MQPLLRRSAPLLAALLLSPLTAAQTGPVPAPLEHDLPPAPPSGFSLDGWTAVGEVDGALHAGAAGYSARFGADGLEFRPVLGEDAPATRALHLTTASISVGDAPLLQRPHRSEPVLDGHEVAIGLGSGVTERYTVRPDGLQLDFVFETLPSRHGDLRVELDLATDLQFAGALPDSALAFDDGPRGRAATIGAVLGLDAAGRSAPGTVHLAGDRLVLELPQAFIATAELPLVLDPLITGPDAAANGTGARHLDFTWSGASQRWGAVFTRFVSGTDTSVYFANFPDGGVPDFPLAIVDDFGTKSDPTLAYNNQTDRFLVSWVSAAGALGPYDLLARTFGPGPGNTFIGNTVELRTDLPRNPDPDSGSESTVADDDVLVVHVSGDTLRSLQVSVPANASPFIVNDVLVDGSSNTICSNPAISKGGGSAGRYLIAWQRTTSFSESVRTRVVDRNNSLLGPGGNPATFAFDRRNPDVDGDGESWLVVFESGSTPGDSDILAREMVWDGSNVAFGDHPTITVDADPSDNEVDPAVAWVGSKYLVAWADERTSIFAGPFEYDVFFKGYSADDCQECESETLLTSGPAFRNGLAMGTQVSTTTNAVLDHAMLGWNEQTLGVPPASQAVTALLEGVGDGGPSIDTGGGCGSGGTLTRNGPIALGATTQYVLSGASPAATLAILNIAPPTTPVVCADCVWVPFKFTFVQPVVGGGAFQNVIAPCNTDLVGLAYDVQWTVVVPGETPCSLSPDIAVSNRLAIEIGL